jgi:hypothetical protein
MKGMDVIMKHESTRRPRTETRRHRLPQRRWSVETIDPKKRYDIDGDYPTVNDAGDLEIWRDRQLARRFPDGQWKAASAEFESHGKGRSKPHLIYVRAIAE